jgi:hypothetical protein
VRLELAPQRDALQQRAGRIHARQAVAERGIHVEVGIDKRRAQQIAAGIDLLRRHQRQARPDGGDASMLDGNVDAMLPVGQIGVAYHDIHQALPLI